MRVFVCLFALAVASVKAGSIPSFLTACSASDPKLNTCIENTITAGGKRFSKGIPEIGIASLDPAQLGTVYCNNPALKLTFTDTVVTGLGDFRLNSFKMSPEKGKAILDFTANVTLKGNYEMDGQVLILPIRGKGQAKIKITNLNIVIKYDFITNKAGFWEVPNYRDTYKMDRAQFKFTNLFNGMNNQLAETTLKFLNDQWRIVMSEIAPPAVESIIKACVDVVKKFFSVVPARELLKP